MKGIAMFARVLLAALAVSGAKLPLPSPAEDSAGIHIPVPSQLSTLYEAPSEIFPAPSQPAISVQTPAEIPPVPVDLSSLYEAPSESIPAPAQPVVSVQTHAQIPSVPAELSTLYEAPVEDHPSAAQLPLQVQISEVPSLLDLPVQTFQTPFEESTAILSGSSLASVQQPVVDFVPVPAEPSVLYEDPTEAFSSSAQQPSLIQVPSEIPSGSSEPIDLHQIPDTEIVGPQQPSLVQSTVTVPVQGGPTTLETAQVGSVPSLVQQVHVPQTQILVVQEPSVPSSLYQVPVPFEDISATVQQPALVQTPVQTGPVPVGLSQEVTEGNFQLPSQTSSFGQAVVSQEQDVLVLETAPNNVPVIVVESATSAPSAPAVLSGLYETPEASFPAQSELVPQVGPTGVNIEASSEFLTPALPQANTPVNLHQAEGQAIVFPELVPIPEVPSDLYEIPEQSPTGSQGRSIISAIDEITPAASEPVASVTKGQMMKGMPYDFQWGVLDAESRTGFTHSESSDGKRTSGEYRVTLPDGRIQIVNFYDNGDGFHADITYE